MCRSPSHTEMYEVTKNPEQGQMFFRLCSGGAAQTGKTFPVGVLSQPITDVPKPGARRLASAEPLSTGRCGSLHRCLCSDYVDPYSHHLLSMSVLYHRGLRVVKLSRKTRFLSRRAYSAHLASEAP